MKLYLISYNLTHQSLLLENIDLQESWWWLRNANKPILFVESAWNGYLDRWKFQIAAYPDYPERNNDKLVRLIEKAKSKGIPTVFWNKEDSVHYIEVIIIAQNYNDQELLKLEQKLKDSSKVFRATHVIKNDSEDTLGKRLNQGIALSQGEYVAKFDDDDFYFPNYLQDMLIPFKFGDYGIVGKKEIFIYLEGQNKTFVRYKGQRHMETDFLTGATLVFSRKALTQLSFGDLNRGEDSNILEQAKKLKIKTYVADPFNFVVYRSKELSNHTWQVEDKFFTDKGGFIGEGLAENIVKL